MVNWTADKDQTILRGIFVFHDIKNSGPLLDYLAQQIGEGCTPKAVSHRLTSLRKSGKMTNTPSPKTCFKAAGTPRTPRTPVSGRGRAKGTATKKTINAGSTTDEATDDEEPTPSPSMNRKRARTSKTPASYAESDATTGDDEDEFTPEPKRVKAEPVEDEGVAGVSTGAAGVANGDDHVQDEVDDEGIAFV